MDDLHPQAFSVPNRECEYDLDQPPATGEEFLQRAYWEAKKCPRIVVSKINPRDYDHLRSKKRLISAEDPSESLPDHLRPTTEWKASYVAYFRQYRQSMLALNHNKDLEAVTLAKFSKDDWWKKFCFDEKTCQSPTPKILASMDQATIDAVINYYSEWLHNARFSRKRGEWLYSLFSLIDAPLLPQGHPI
eukprot:TRINITY_DN7093_c0_g1_i1.p1 TRINITY_DN7093_c0_g1~~TRINITY_DN7093_c0_g1_i1.p1  ORF type:complete len:190 (+),score=48.54 TRINITY_DN7093_c0_g1_i1:42-611(+)